MTRDLGRLGENIFEAWCSSVGLIANKSYVDKSGWDFIVESPLVNLNNTPLDLTPTPIECKIQVKSTDQKYPKTQIKLDNLLRLVKYGGPAFICFLQFDKTDNPVAAYLREIDKELIRKTLLKLRKLDSKNDTAIHKKTITVKCLSENSFQTNGSGLLKEINRFLKNNTIEAYIKEKHNYVASVGYEENNVSGNLSIISKNKNPVDDLVDLAIGLKKTLKVSEFSLHDVRFGINSREPVLFGEDGDISVGINGTAQCKVSFIWPSISEHIAFDAQILVPQALIQNLPLDKTKVRVKTRFLDLIVDFSLMKTDMTFIFPDGEEKFPLYEFYNLTRLFQLLALDGVMPDIKLHIGKSSPIMLSTRNSSFIDIDKPIFPIVDLAWKVAKLFNLSEQIETSLNEILDTVESNENILMLSSHKEQCNFCITGTLKGEVKLEPSQDAVLITSAFSTVGGKVLVSIITYVGKFDSTVYKDRNFTLKSSELEQYKKYNYIYEDNEQINIAELDTAITSLQKEFEGRGKVIIVFVKELFPERVAKVELYSN